MDFWAAYLSLLHKTLCFILQDKETKTVVNNESSEIIEMLNSEFNEFAKSPEVNLFPEELRANIRELDFWIYPQINNGVYRSGFARSQEACTFCIGKPSCM